jgi:hypothetical protein
MSARGYYKPRPPGTLKAAEAALIAACGGPVAAQDKCSVGKTVLQQASDCNHPRRHLSLPVVMELEAACDKPILSAFLVLARGCLVEPVKALAVEPMPMALGRITKEMGELLSAAAMHMQHGTLTRAHAQTILRETDDVVAALLPLRAIARQMIETEVQG